jgi:hypothetical protein
MPPDKSSGASPVDVPDDSSDSSDSSDSYDDFRELAQDVYDNNKLEAEYYKSGDWKPSFAADGSPVFDIGTRMFPWDRDEEKRHINMLGLQKSGTCYIHSTLNAILNSSVRESLAHSIRARNPDGIFGVAERSSGDRKVLNILTEVFKEQHEVTGVQADFIYSKLRKGAASMELVQDALLMALINAAKAQEANMAESLPAIEKRHSMEYDFLYALLDTWYEALCLSDSRQEFLRDKDGGTQPAVLNSILGIDLRTKRTASFAVSDVDPEVTRFDNVGLPMDASGEERMAMLEIGNGFDECGMLTVLVPDDEDEVSGIVSKANHAVAYVRMANRTFVLDANIGPTTLHDYPYRHNIHSMIMITPGDAATEDATEDATEARTGGGALATTTRSRFGAKSGHASRQAYRPRTAVSVSVPGTSRERSMKVVELSVMALMLEQSGHAVPDLFFTLFDESSSMSGGGQKSVFSYAGHAALAAVVGMFALLPRR